MVYAGRTAAEAAELYNAGHPLEPHVTADEVEAAWAEAGTETPLFPKRIKGARPSVKPGARP